MENTSTLNNIAEELISGWERLIYGDFGLGTWDLGLGACDNVVTKFKKWI